MWDGRRIARVIDVELLEPKAAGDAELVARLTRLVNEVYEVAEEGLHLDA